MDKKFFTCFDRRRLSAFVLVVGMIMSAMSLTSCSKLGRKSSMQGIPFQLEEGGSWGMLLLDQPDKPLFSEEFDSEPTPVYDGCFSVRDKDGLYRFYSAEAKPKQIGEAYAQVGVFSDGVAPTVKPGEHISLIDKSGKTIQLLDRVEGKRILSCSSFVDGRALYETEEGKFGYLNKHGRSVIPAKYVLATDFAGGRAFIIEEKYKKYMDKGDEESWKHVTVSVIDTDGKVIANFHVTDSSSWASIKQLQWQTYLGFASANYLDWSNAGKHGIYDTKGKVVVKADKRYRAIPQITDDGFVYQGVGGLLGYSNLKGEKIIREKYMELQSLSPERFIARKANKNEWYVIDKEDNRLATYDYLAPIPRTKLLLATDGDSKILIDYDGKRVGKMEVYNLGGDNSQWEVEDRYTPAELTAEALRMTANGFLGLTFRSDTKVTANALGYKSPEDVRKAGYSGNFIEQWKSIGGNSYRLRTSFNGDVFNAEWEKVIHNGFFFGEWKLTNAHFAPSSLRTMRVSISLSSDQNRALFEAFQKYLYQWGCREISSEPDVYIAQNGPIYYILVCGAHGFSFVYAKKSLLDGTIQQLAQFIYGDMGGRSSSQMTEPSGTRDPSESYWAVDSSAVEVVDSAAAVLEY